jgi:repressor LexA
MVAIWLPNRDETTLKYFYKEKDQYRLQPANPTMQPILIDKDEPLEIKGKVVMVIRSLESVVI